MYPTVNISAPFEPDPTLVSGVKSGRDLDPPYPINCRKSQKLSSSLNFVRFFASILSRFSALFSNEVFAPVKKEVSVLFTCQSNEQFDN
jgi:hypothetical protein